MIDFHEISDPEKWELFARDFLSALGYIIETSPDRGADGGKDLLVIEKINGKFSSYNLRWLVSCKNFIESGRAVSENDEPNLLERCQSFGADGFIGFYSTIPSSGLNNRLIGLKSNNTLKDFKIFDSQFIEHCLYEYDLSKIIFQYFPVSYKRIRPMHEIFDQLVNLKCDVCGKDLFPDINEGKDTAIITSIQKLQNDKTIYVDTLCACKGPCDQKIDHWAYSHGYSTSWEDLTDLARPNVYLRYVLCLINQLHDKDKYEYMDKALENEKHILIALAQKAFHEVTQEEKELLHEYTYLI